MRALPKPVSSPSRPDNFPPPLMRFNIGSKSRRKPRASPIFYTRRKRNPSRVIEATQQEPSSPKVTCFGQVRASRAAASAVTRRRRWWLLNKTLISEKLQLEHFSPIRVLGKWVLLFKCGGCKKVDVSDDCDKSENISESEDFRRNSENEEISKRGDKFENYSFSPPKNAVILTRCRSAPYKASSLGGLIWGSYYNGDESGAKLEVEPNCENLVEESKIGEKLEKNNVEELKGLGGGGAVHPLLLTRCKSEPAITGERLLNQEPKRQRRLDEC